MYYMSVKYILVNKWSFASQRHVTHTVRFNGLGRKLSQAGIFVKLYLKCKIKFMCISSDDYCKNIMIALRNELELGQNKM